MEKISGKKTQERIAEKADIVSTLSKNITEFGSFLVFEYLGLDSEEMTNLRKQFRKIDSKLFIHKNNILNRSLAHLNIDAKGKMTGPNAILLTRNDIRPFQQIIKMSKEKKFISLKMAFIDNEVIMDRDLESLSSLGTKEDLLAKLCRTLISPMQKLALLLKHISKE